jgi:hypothetical protein
VAALAIKWECDDEDAASYAERLGIKLYMDGDAWCAARADAINLQESPHGFGPTALDAMADLCKQLGYRAAKMWGPTFQSLTKVKDAAGALDPDRLREDRDERVRADKFFSDNN